MSNQSASGHLQAHLESSNDLHFLYETNNAVTHTYNNSIVSVLDVPLANYNQMKNKIVKNFDTSNKLRIANFELISGKKYDLMICNKEISFIHNVTCCVIHN